MAWYAKREKQTRASGHSGAAESARPTTTAPRASVITRPVAALYSNRRPKAPRPPGLLWQSYLPDFPWPSRRASGSGPQALPSANFLVPAAVFQIFVMALMGLIGVLSRSTMAPWQPGRWRAPPLRARAPPLPMRPVKSSFVEALCALCAGRFPAWAADLGHAGFRPAPVAARPGSRADRDRVC